MVKKIIVSSLIISSLAIGFIAVADNITTPPTTANTTSPTMMSPSAMASQMVLQVGPNGKVLLRGIVDGAPTSTSLTVKSWGGDWTVNISSSTNLMPNDITQFKTGDFVGVQGTVSQSSSWTIDAMLVRDKASGEQNIQEKKDMLKMRSQHEGEGQQGQGPQGSQDYQGMMGLKKPSENFQSGSGQGVQQQIQSILEQIKKIQAQIGAQQTQPTPSAQPMPSGQ